MSAEEPSAARTRSIALPIAAGVILFAAIVWVQFSGALGQNGFFAEIALGLGFYYCYAWHNKLAANAKAKPPAASRK